MSGTQSVAERFDVPEQVETGPREKLSWLSFAFTATLSWFHRAFSAPWNAIKKTWSLCSTTLSSLWTKFKDWWRNKQEKVRNAKAVRWLKAAFPGWELGVIAAIAVAIFAFNVNLVFLVVAFVKHKPNSKGLGTLWKGNCKKVDWVNKGVHGFINILSTILISQSNYCMQLLASPTRNDVDAAHKKREWVDIGMPSLRNVWKKHISYQRIACWTLLGLGSVPLHLLWNSVIIYSPIAYQYNQLAVTEGFVRGLPIDNIDGLVSIEYSSEGPGSLWPDNIHFLQQEMHNYEKLNNQDCKKKYAQHFIQDRSDVIVVTKTDTPDTNTSTALGGASAGWGPWPYQWLCPPESRQKLACSGSLAKPGDDWIFPNYGGPRVEYCLSKKMKMECRLEYAFLVAILTVVANSLKIACFIATYWLLKKSAKNAEKFGAEGYRKMQPLMTTGDAIASFLEFEDKTTVGMSTVEKEDFENGIWNLRWVHINPMPWRERYPCFRFRAIGIRRWLIGTAILFAIPFFPSAFLLSKRSWLMDDLGLDKDAIQQLGIGSPSGLFLFGIWNGNIQLNETFSLGGQPNNWSILRNIVAANTPQLAISLAYYIWNSHLTVMIAAREYTMYAVKESDEAMHHKPEHSLRVTQPREGSGQRAAYFLTIPLRYWAPITALWTLLHWLASQAIFFARVDLLSHWLQITEFSISQVGYSVLGMICFLAVSLVVFLIGVGISVKKIDNRMPLAATCSGALSAACHPKDPGLKHHEREVHWGVEKAEDDSIHEQESGEKLERCTFTSLDAHYPCPDQFYA